MIGVRIYLGQKGGENPMVDANEMVDERRGVEAELAANETLIFVVPLALDENPRLTVNISVVLG